MKKVQNMFNIYKFLSLVFFIFNCVWFRAQSKKEIIEIKEIQLVSLRKENTNLKSEIFELKLNLDKLDSTLNSKLIDEKKLNIENSNLVDKIKNKEIEFNDLSRKIEGLNSLLKQKELKNQLIFDSLNSVISIYKPPLTSYEWSENNRFPILKLQNQTIEKQLNKKLFEDCFEEEIKDSRQILIQKLDSLGKIIKSENYDNYPNYICNGFKVNYNKFNILSLELFKSYLTGAYPNSWILSYNFDLTDGSVIDLSENLTLDGIRFVKQLILSTYKTRLSEVNNKVLKNGDNLNSFKEIIESAKKVNLESIQINNYKILDDGIIILVDLAEFPHVYGSYNPDLSYFVSWNDLDSKLIKNSKLEKVAGLIDK